MLAPDGRRIGGPHLGLHKRVSVFESLRHCLIFALRLLAARRLHRFLRRFLCVVGSWMDGRRHIPTVIKLARRKRKCHPRYSAGRSAPLADFSYMYVRTYEGENVKSFTTFIAMQPLVADHAFMPHLKALYVPFHMAYSGLICSKGLQSDRPK